jgi:hypothetical protein
VGMLIVTQSQRPAAVPGNSLLIGAAPFMLAGVAAVMVLRGQIAGLWLSCAAQLLQVVGWAAARSTWLFCAGIFVGIDASGSSASLFAGWQTTVEFGLGNAGPPRLALNVIPLLSVGLMLWPGVRHRTGRQL